MIYEYICEKCGSVRPVDAKPFHPPTPPLHCERPMRRLYGAIIDTSDCQDHDYIPEEKRLCPNPHGLTKAQVQKREKRYREGIHDRRRQIAESGKRGGWGQTHAIPPELYHGKIKQTGDKNYWRDKGNVKRHNNWRTDTYGRARRGKDGSR